MKKISLSVQANLFRVAFASFIALGAANAARGDWRWTGGSTESTKNWSDSANWAGDSGRYLISSSATISFSDLTTIPTGLGEAPVLRIYGGSKETPVIFTTGSSDDRSKGLTFSNGAGNAVVGGGVDSTDSADGYLTIKGGYYKIGANDLVIGGYNGKNGVLTLEYGKIETYYWLVMGGYANGSTNEFNIMGGEVQVGDGNGRLVVGQYGDSKATVNQTGGVVVSRQSDAALEIACNNAVGTYNISGGSYTGTGNAWLGNGNGSKAYVNVSGSGSMSLTGDLILGYASGSYGEFNLKGGTVGISGNIQIGGATSSSGEVVISGGELTAGQFSVGKGGSGSLTVSGSGRLLGYNTVQAQDYYVGHSSYGELTISDNGYVSIGKSDSPKWLKLNNGGKVVLKGGILDLSSIKRDDSSEVSVEFDGGTMRAYEKSGWGNLVQSGVLLKVMVNGAKVEIPTGIANISDSPFKTGVEGENIDGGLTKLGDGTFTLPSGNTYTGASIVEAGTLEFTETSPKTAGIVLKGGSVSAPANFVVPYVELASDGEASLPSWYATSMKLIISGDTTLVVPQGTTLGDVEFKDNGKIVYEVDDYTAGNEVAIGLIGDISLPTESTLGSCMKARVDGYVYECSTLSGSVSVPASSTVWKNEVQTGDFNSADNWSNGVPTPLKLGIFNSAAEVSSTSSIEGSVKISSAANVTFTTQAIFEDIQVESGGKVTISGVDSQITHVLTGGGDVDIKAATAISGNISGALVINWTGGGSVHLSGDNSTFSGSFTANSFQQRMYFDSADSGSALAEWNLVGDAQVTPSSGTIKFGALNYTKNDYCVFYFDDNSSVVVEVGEKGSDCELSVDGDCWLGKISSYMEVPGNVRIVKKGTGKMRFGMGNVNHLEVAGGELSLVGNKFPLREIVLSGGVVSTESAVNEMLSYDYVSGKKHFSNLFEVTSNGGTLALPYDATISAPVQCAGKLVKTGNGTLTIASGFAGEIEVKGGKVVLPCGTEITSAASANVVEVKRGYVTVSAGREFSSVKLEDNGALAIDMSEMSVGFTAVNQTVDLLTISSYTMSDDEEIDGCVFAVGTPYLSHIAFENNKLSATSVYHSEGNMWICLYTNGYGDGMWSTSENWMNGIYPNKRSYTIFTSEYNNSDFGKDKTENCAFGRIALRNGTELAAKAKNGDPTLSAIEICGNGCLSCAHIGLAIYGDVGMTISAGVTFRTRIYSGDSDSWISSSGGQLITVNGPYICEDGRLVVYNKTIFNGPFTYKSVDGTAQISDNTEMNGNLTVTGNIAFNNSTKINRTVTLKSGASFTMYGTFGNDAKLELDGCDLANCTLASGLEIPSLVVKEGAILSGITDQTVTNVKFEDGSYFVVALGEGNTPAMLTASSFEFGRNVYGILSATDAANAENGQIYAGSVTGAPKATVLGEIGGEIAESAAESYYWTTTHGVDGVWLNAAQVAATTVETEESSVSIRDADLAAWLTAKSATESVNTANANGVTGIMAYMTGAESYTGAQKPVLDAAVADGKATLTFDESAFRSVPGLKLKYYLKSCDNADFSGEVEKGTPGDDPEVELDITTAKIYNRLCAEVYAAE